MSQRILVRDADDYIHNLTTFNANNLRAILPHGDGEHQYTGGMTTAAADQYYHDAEKMGIRYVVLSYDVPIAWTTGRPDVRRCPRAYYSATTTQHQDIVRSAWREFF
jgi:hypothetical protein